MFQKVVAEMNRLGMIIDLTGTSNQTQLDVLKLSKAPVIFSHSASFALVQHPRNIQNDVLLQLVSELLTNKLIKFNLLSASI